MRAPRAVVELLQCAARDLLEAVEPEDLVWRARRDWRRHPLRLLRAAAQHRA